MASEARGASSDLPPSEREVFPYVAIEAFEDLFAYVPQRYSQGIVADMKVVDETRAPRGNGVHEGVAYRMIVPHWAFKSR